MGARTVHSESVRLVKLVVATMLVLYSTIENIEQIVGEGVQERRSRRREDYSIRRIAGGKKISLTNQLHFYFCY